MAGSHPQCAPYQAQRNKIQERKLINSSFFVRSPLKWDHPSSIHLQRSMEEGVQGAEKAASGTGCLQWEDRLWWRRTRLYAPTGGSGPSSSVKSVPDESRASVVLIQYLNTNGPEGSEEGDRNSVGLTSRLNVPPPFEPLKTHDHRWGGGKSGRGAARFGAESSMVEVRLQV